MAATAWCHVARLASANTLYFDGGSKVRHNWSVKIYKGSRSPNGTAVAVDGQPLRRHILRGRPPADFDWGAQSAGAEVLALSILVDCRSRTSVSVLAREFAEDITVKLQSVWEFTS